MSAPIALTETVVRLYKARRFNQPVELIFMAHAEAGYSTPMNNIAKRLREVINDVAEFYPELSPHPVQGFYFEHGYRCAGELKGGLDEEATYYKSALACLAIGRQKIAGLRFATKQGDRLYCVWHNEIMKIPSGLIVSRANKIVKASVAKTIPPHLTKHLLRRPVQALRAGIDDVKAISLEVRELKDKLDAL